VVSATPNHEVLSNITFRAFAEFVEENFSSTVSLATVLVTLFTISDNSDLLNLHSRMQHPKMGERSHTITGWIKALARALSEKLGQNNTKRLFKRSEEMSDHDNERLNQGLAVKLDALYQLLDISPYNDQDERRPIYKESKTEIEPAYVICPISMECQTTTCNGRSLLLTTRDRDVPRVTLIKGSTLHQKVHLLTGECSVCHTKYFADHETSARGISSQSNKFYLNNAKYLKVGQSVWVDRVFSTGVINGMYQFHASASAFAEFWNDTFWSTQKVKARKLSRRQVWHAFMQESIRTVARSSKVNLELVDGLAIAEVTKQAFSQLGENGVIRSAENHFCSECTHEYKATPDRITGDDPAAVLGIDENRQVPVLTGEDAGLAVQDAARARFAAENAMVVDRSPSPHEEASPVKMVVIDGVVMGPTHCAYDDCTQDLQNARGGVFCGFHEIVHGNMCRMHDCNNPKVPPSQTCALHHNRWYSHVIRYGRQSLLGVRRLVRRSEEERLPWLPQVNRQVQPHDAAAAPQNRKDNYFVAPRFYCVETICAPCGAVIAWTLFDKAESPTNILHFLEAVYPTPDLRPNYVCIDKACAVLRTSISNGAWNTWNQTTRFIVDSYHYINHRTTDYLCRKWCNPAPLNGSAPNLVIVENDVDGNPHYKRAFNSQACEQLNAWLGGFQPILNRMTIHNFRWFLHVMLFIHTQRVIQKQKDKEKVEENWDEEDEEGIDVDEDDL